VDSVLQKVAEGQYKYARIYPIGSEEALFKQCEGGSAGCRFVRMDMRSGQLREFAPEKPNSYRYELSRVSSDGRLAYLIAYDAKEFNEIFLEAYRSGVRNPTLPAPELFVIDTQDNSIMERKPLPGIRTSIHPDIRVSPSGKYAAYVSDRGKVTIHDIAEGSNTIIKLPSEWIINSWGGQTISPDPMWSPSGSKIVFTAWVSGGANTVSTFEKKILAYIDAETGEYKSIAEIDTSGDTPENIGGSGVIRNYISGIGWYTDEVIQYTHIQGSSPRPQDKGDIAVVGNYAFDTRTNSIIELTTEYGQIVGISDGHY